MNETHMTQIELPGMPIKKPFVNQIIAKNIPLGSVVSYTGTLKGGPKFGSLGVVQKTKNRKPRVIECSHLSPRFFLGKCQR